MQTTFSLAQLADPDLAEAEKILRSCVHCGFCTATCPTYALLGDELDSPRGRIYLIKDMLENERPASPEVVKHIDRCLSCLACMTTCPSGVHYMHLIDHARGHVEKTYRRPAVSAFLRWMLSRTMTRPALFKLSLFAALVAKPLAPVFAWVGLKPVAAMLRLSPTSLPPRTRRMARNAGENGPRRRVALLTGCVADVLSPAVNEATIRVFERLGFDVVPAAGEGCCGALAHHMGREEEALAAARNNVDAWMRARAQGGLDAILITASGCGTTIKDYGYMLRKDADYAAKAAQVAGLARDVCEFLATLDPTPAGTAEPLAVAYHAACSLAHGQKITRQPRDLLTRMGFEVREVPEGHLCCGSAGTYNILQPDIAERLRERKVANIAKVGPDVIAAGNIGCITQIAAGTQVPVVHTIELIDWACGGPRPARL